MRSRTRSRRRRVWRSRAGLCRRCSSLPRSIGVFVVASVVIGGNGFLGSYLVESLVERGHEVTVFDRFSHDPVVPFPEPVRLVTGDVSDVAALRKAFEGA